MAHGTAQGTVDEKVFKKVFDGGGGGFVDGFYNHPQAAPFFKTFEALGGTKEMAAEFIAPIDPITLARNLKDRNDKRMPATPDNPHEQDQESSQIELRPDADSRLRAAVRAAAKSGPMHRPAKG